MKRYIIGFKRIIKNNTKLLIGLCFGLLISLPLGVYALKSHSASNSLVNQNQATDEQPKPQNKTTTTTPTNPTATPANTSETSSQTGSTNSNYKPSNSNQTTQSAPTLLSCTNNNDVPYETHSLYRNGAGHIQGVNGWSKTCVYSDGHSTKETYSQPVTEYFYVYWYTPDTNQDRQQCADYVGVSHTQAIDECVALTNVQH